MCGHGYDPRGYDPERNVSDEDDYKPSEYQDPKEKERWYTIDDFLRSSNPQPLGYGEY